MIVGLMTLSFDLLIAYKISSSLFSMQVFTGLSEGSWGVTRAFQDINFWLLFFAGSVVSVLWSLLWLFNRRQWDCFHSREVAIKSREGEISRLKINLEQVRGDKIDTNAQIKKNQALIDQCERFSQMQIVNWEELDRDLEQFHLGWTEYLSENSDSERQAKEEIEQVKVILDEVKSELMEKVEKINQQIEEVFEEEVS